MSNNKQNINDIVNDEEEYTDEEQTVTNEDDESDVNEEKDEEEDEEDEEEEEEEEEDEDEKEEELIVDTTIGIKVIENNVAKENEKINEIIKRRDNNLKLLGDPIYKNNFVTTYKMSINNIKYLRSIELKRDLLNKEYVNILYDEYEKKAIEALKGTTGAVVDPFDCGIIKLGMIDGYLIIMDGEHRISALKMINKINMQLDIRVDLTMFKNYSELLNNLNPIYKIKIIPERINNIIQWIKDEFKCNKKTKGCIITGRKNSKMPFIDEKLFIKNVCDNMSIVSLSKDKMMNQIVEQNNEWSYAYEGVFESEKLTEKKIEFIMNKISENNDCYLGCDKKLSWVNDIGYNIDTNIGNFLA